MTELPDDQAGRAVDVNAAPFGYFHLEPSVRAVEIHASEAMNPDTLMREVVIRIRRHVDEPKAERLNIIIDQSQAFLLAEQLHYFAHRPDANDLAARADEA